MIFKFDFGGCFVFVFLQECAGKMLFCICSPWFFVCELNKFACANATFFAKQSFFLLKEIIFFQCPIFLHMLHSGEKTEEGGKNYNATM